MSYGIYIAVSSGSGTITCSNSYKNWSTSGSSATGYTGFDISATFTATPASGYEFSYFQVAVNTASTGSGGVVVGKSTSNPYTISAGYVSDGQAYSVYAYFEQAVVTYNCSAYSYLDGSYYDSISDTVDSGSYFYLSGLSVPSNSVLDYATINGTTYSYLPSSVYVSSTTTVYAYYLTAWTLSTGALGTVSSSTSSASVSLSTYTLKRYSFTAGATGTLTAYTSGSLDTIGYLSTSTSWDSSTGAPASYLAYDDDSAGSNNNFQITYDVTAGTTYYIWVRAYSGSNSGSTTLYASIRSRPSDWSWTTTVSSGSAIKLTAAEWNNFTSRINEFRDYTGLSSYSFTTAVSGTTQIEYSICNQAWTAINAITDHGTMPTKLASDGVLYASFFNGLKDALNAIP